MTARFNGAEASTKPISLHLADAGSWGRCYSPVEDGGGQSLYAVAARLAAFNGEAWWWQSPVTPLFITGMIAVGQGIDTAVFS
jgi:hypothetical protein